MDREIRPHRSNLPLLDMIDIHFGLRLPLVKPDAKLFYLTLPWLRERETELGRNAETEPGDEFQAPGSGEHA